MIYTVYNVARLNFYSESNRVFLLLPIHCKGCLVTLSISQCMPRTLPSIEMALKWAARLLSFSDPTMAAWISLPELSSKPIIQINPRAWNCLSQPGQTLCTLEKYRTRLACYVVPCWTTGRYKVIHGREASSLWRDVKEILRQKHQSWPFVDFILVMPMRVFARRRYLTLASKDAYCTQTRVIASGGLISVLQWNHLPLCGSILLIMCIFSTGLAD